MNQRILQMMYQQWQQGNSDYKIRWAEFVEMAATDLKIGPDQILKQLQKQWWFEWNE